MADEDREEKLTTSGVSPPEKIAQSDVFKEDQSIAEIKPAEPIQSSPREKTRSRVTFILIWTLPLSIAWLFSAPLIASFIPSFDKAFFTDMVKTVYPPLITLVGSAMGYYFGSETK